MGLTHIYCGDGKGKTTAAVGLAVRAAGSGMSLLPNITVDRPQKNYGFTFSMSDADKAELTACHNAMLGRAAELMNSGSIQMLIVDEFFAGYNSGLVDKALAERLVFDKPENCELVLTGRDPAEKFISDADYVSEIKAVKHPYEKGIPARKGIEY